MSGFLTRSRAGRILLLGLGLLLAACSEAPQDGIRTGADTPELRISDARIRVPVPGRDRTAGYLHIENRGETPVVLTGVSSDRIPRIEMHSMEMDGDMMKMRRLDEVTIPPGASVLFEPGGNHLMLFGVGELEPETPVILHSDDGREFPVAFRTIPIGGE